MSNISTRGFVGLDDNVLIGGIVIAGNVPTTVTIRARGPSLRDFGVVGVLDDPTLELFDQSGRSIDFVDNWADQPAAESTSDVLQPTHPAEAALTVVFVPGAYTAVIRGEGGTTGIEIVEAVDTAQYR